MIEFGHFCTGKLFAHLVQPRPSQRQIRVLPAHPPPREELGRSARSYGPATSLAAPKSPADLVCRLLLEKKKWPRRRLDGGEPARAALHVRHRPCSEPLEEILRVA